MSADRCSDCASKDTKIARLTQENTNLLARVLKTERERDTLKRKVEAYHRRYGDCCSNV